VAAEGRADRGLRFPIHNFKQPRKLLIQLRDLATRVRARGVIIPCALAMRARGTPDARRIRSPVCKVVKAHERSHHEHAENIRRSARGGAPACFVLSPATVET
jgi:hypothetical protein